MGFFSDDDENQPSQSAKLLQEQIQANQVELESKRQNLFQTRLDIIKGQGGQVWEPRPTGASARGGRSFNSPNMNNAPWDIVGRATGQNMPGNNLPGSGQGFPK